MRPRKIIATKSPILFKLDAYRYYIQGIHAFDAFMRAAEHHNVPLTKTMQTKQGATGYMTADVINLLTRRLLNNDAVVCEYFRTHQLPDLVLMRTKAISKVQAAVRSYGS